MCLLGVVACGGGLAVTQAGPASRPALHSSGQATRPRAIAASVHAGHGRAAAPHRTTAPRISVPSGCGTRPARRAWAMDLAANGRVLWRDRLPTNATQSGVPLQPVALGGTAVFAEENALYALRLSNGRRLWRRVFPLTGGDLFAGMIYGLWQWRGTMAVLVGQASSAARLVSLNAATGAVRWTLPLSRPGVTGDLALTGDGGLAMILGDGTLAVADLSTGSLRWSRPGSYSPAPGPVVAGGTVVAAADGTGSAADGVVAGFGTRTGKLLWTRRGMPDQPQLQAAAGRVLVYTNTQGVFPHPALWPVTAVSPATGQTLWRVATAGPVDALSGEVAVTTTSPSELYMIDAASGRVRWRLATDVAGGLPLVTGTGVVYVSDSAGNAPGGGQRLVDLRAAGGSARWTVPLAEPVFLLEPALPLGRDVVVSLGSGEPGDPARLVGYLAATGAVAWTTVVPTLVQVPPVAAGANLLVQPTDPAVACAADGSAVS
jgi:outer membrane protein assembly factor BamB